MMKYFAVIILVATLFSACSTDKCTRSFSKDFNMSVLSLWEKQTDINLAYRKDDTLISFFKSAARDSISIFDRRAFLQDIANLSQLNAYNFDSLIVIEINVSGEVYISKKYFLAFCGQEAVIIKFQLSPKKWEFIQAYKSSTNKLDDAVELLINRNDNTIYWGNNTTDLVSVSKFRGNNDISVEVFGTISEKQYKALGIMEK